MKLIVKSRRKPYSSTSQAWKRAISILWPGLLLTVLVALLALLIYKTSKIGFLNPLLTAVILGIGIRNLIGVAPQFQPGIKFSMKRILRLAVILLGLKLSLSEVLAVGPVGLFIVILSSVSTFGLTCWLGKLFGINRKLTQIIAAGTSICGASAVVATNAVVESSEEDVTYAIALITGFGTLAMLLYPLVPELLHLSPQAFGIWCGASVHEVAQVVATAFQNGTVSGEFATITKLSRVLLLIPVVFMLGWSTRQTKQELNANPSQIPVPWFVLLFGALILINSANLFPDALKLSVLSFNQFLLCISMAAMGLETNFHKLSRIGLKPIYLAGCAWLFLAVTSLGMIMLSMRF